jgi:hypothetical protein
VAPPPAASPSVEPIGPEPTAPEPSVPTVVEPTASAATLVARPAQQDVMFVPLAVSIGDGFKFGCGFFLAMVVAVLVGFIFFAVLFVLTSLFGLNLPLSR